MFDPYVEHVWSLCDGQTPVQQIVARSRLGSERTLSVLATLRRLGAIVLAADTAEAVAERVADYDRTRSEASGVHFLPQPPTQRIARGSSPPPMPEAAPVVAQMPIPEPAAPIPEPAGPLAAGSVSIEPLSPQEVEVVAEQSDLTSDEKRQAIAMWRIVGRGNPYEILDVDHHATPVQIQSAYRVRCKQFHPDRFYGRNLGTFSRWMSEIFDGVQAAYGKLSAMATESPFQTKREHAAELFGMACRLEANGKSEEALRMFSAACRVDKKPIHLRRAARCALNTGDTDRAEYWALEAVDRAATDPSTLRVLADVYRAQDRLVRAEVVLKRAVELCTGSETLALELRRDLDRVQNWLRRC